jgi:TatD DNase family protein
MPALATPVGGATQVIDTHAHLDACADSAEDLVTRAREAGVGRIIAIGSGIESSRSARAFAERLPGVFAALGVHPHQAAESDAEQLDELRELLTSERAVAVGETGLDFYRDYAPRARQTRLFEQQLALAAEVGKTVVVHTRAANEATAAALADFQGSVVLHCFSEPDLLTTALERGYFVSFAGNVTYPNAGALRMAAAQVPPDRLLAETDSPYLAPQPRRGRPNEPANVVHTVAALAEVRGLDSAGLAAQIDANAAAAFGLP